jgi:hypothetical protein
MDKQIVNAAIHIDGVEVRGIFNEGKLIMNIKKWHRNEFNLSPVFGRCKLCKSEIVWIVKRLQKKWKATGRHFCPAMNGDSTWTLWSKEDDT